jgi:hypothetical protein
MTAADDPPAGSRQRTVQARALPLLDDIRGGARFQDVPPPTYTLIDLRQRGSQTLGFATVLSLRAKRCFDGALNYVLSECGMPYKFLLII